MSGLRTRPGERSGAAGNAAPESDRPAPGRAPTGRRRRNRSLRPGSWLRPGSLPYLLVLPALCFELLVHLIPMVVGALISFFELNEIYFRNWLRAPFVGLENFRIALNPGNPIGAGLLHSLAVTVAFAALVIGISWLLGMAGALAVNSTVKLRGFLQALFLVPFALPIYVAVINWQFMLQRNGAFNALLGALHITEKNQFWLFGGNAFWSMVMAATWRLWPFAFLILLAGLQSIPPELYQAASVDGASAWRRLRSITLPMLRPVNSVLLLVLFLWTFNDFNVPYVLFGTAAPPSADVLALHIYVNSFVNFDFGLGAAMSVLLLVFLLVMCVWYARAMRMGGERDA